MKTAVIGSDGQLGTDVCEVFHSRGDELSRLTISDLDVTSSGQVRAVLTSLKPDLVINTAAMHNVERCEEYVERAFLVNGIGARNLAQVCRDLDCKLIHISTDYVFDGLKQSPYLEVDTPMPLNVYGVTKLAGENFVRAIAPKHFVVRTSGLFGRALCMDKGGQNFVRLMLKLARERGRVRVVNDESTSPTHTLDLAEQLYLLANTEEYGLYHCAAGRGCTWYEFALAIFELTDTMVNLEVAAPGEFPMKTPRPVYSIMKNARLQSIGLDRMPDWREGLQRYLSLERSI